MSANALSAARIARLKKWINLKGFKLGLPPTEGENIEVNFKVAKKTFSETAVGPKWSSQVTPISGGPPALHNQRSELLFLHFYDFFQQREDKFVCSYSKRIHPQSVPFLRKALWALLALINLSALIWEWDKNNCNKQRENRVTGKKWWKEEKGEIFRETERENYRGRRQQRVCVCVGVCANALNTALASKIWKSFFLVKLCCGGYFSFHFRSLLCVCMYICLYDYKLFMND